MTEQNIPITVGMLTYNSGKALRRALETVRDFDDIIIADGGSTDDTLAIAREYGARVIEQWATKEPSGDPAHPIDDFSRERNQLLDHAKHDWFFWLDSDEYISRELHDELASVAQSETPEHLAYWIHIVRQSPDATITYREWKPNYQIRFLNLTTGGRFTNKMHEKFKFDKGKYSIGTLKGAWYVPTGKPSFDVYKRTVDHRLHVMIGENPPQTFSQAFQRGILKPLVQVGKILARTILMRFYNPWRELIPVSLELQRIFSQWVVVRETWRAYYRKSHEQN